LPTLRTRLNKKTRRSFPATQVGFPDLRIKKPIPGRPEIGAQFQPWIFSYTTRAPSSKKRVSRVRIAPGACTALTPERPSASQDIAFADEPNKLQPFAPSSSVERSSAHPHGRSPSTRPAAAVAVIPLSPRILEQP